MKNRLLFLLLLLVSIGQAFTNTCFVNLESKHVKLIKKKKKQFCYVSFVSVDGTVFLVKQKRTVGQLISAVHDALAAYIAQSIDAHLAHKVAIIPAFKKFPGKIYDDWPATIHTLASGATIKEKRSPYNKMNIKQALEGFRRSMIPWMAKHHQLVKIVALDIFLCNHDRHRGNLFYNANTDRFCAIDMDLLYQQNLAALARQNLLSMSEYDLFPLTIKEFFALLDLHNTLQLLVNKHRPDDIIRLFDELTVYAGLVEDSPLCIEKVKAEIDLSRRMIRQNYHDTVELIKVLGNIVCKAIEQQPVVRNFQVVVDFEKNML